MALTVREPRDSSGSGSSGPAALTDPAAWQERATQLSTRVLNFATGRGWHHQADVASSNGSSEPELQGAACVLEPQQPALAAAAGGAAGAAALVLPGSAAAADADADNAASENSGPPAAAAAAASFLLPIRGLLAIKSFQATTIAAALNDLGSYALIAWHSTFYERVYGLDSGVYAPMLAVILPVGGILGGVGGGLIADYLSVVGGRYWLTAGALRVSCVCMCVWSAEPAAREIGRAHV